MGGPRAFYCPNCRRIRQREANERARKRGGATRPIGSIDKCKLCGAEYVVNSGRQKLLFGRVPKEKRYLHGNENTKMGYNKASGQDIKKGRTAEREKMKSLRILRTCFFHLIQQQTHVLIIAEMKNTKIIEYRAEMKRGINANIEKADRRKK